ncbi:HPr family phosphocarrier protein [Bacillus taeanensis]|uniref:HPr domain-containing protein n=1 Tax=Bacillus taeanensis TaxID=273032 RepID=A0A366XWA1_9BACI|nr:HPr family phosphocarrier protein [Bacillus taeanensis]RBW68423.1 hypothetical protein DS031_16525 [Bacillus taeanensis]
MKKEYYLIVPNSFTVCQAFDVVKIANTFKSRVMFYKDEVSADGKDISSMVLLFLTLKKDDSLLLVVEGPDSDRLWARLTEYMMYASKNENELDCWQQEALDQLAKELKEMKTACVSDLRIMAKSYLKITKEALYSMHKEDSVIYQ